MNPHIDSSALAPLQSLASDSTLRQLLDGRPQSLIGAAHAPGFDHVLGGDGQFSLAVSPAWTEAHLNVGEKHQQAADEGHEKVAEGHASCQAPHGFNLGSALKAPYWPISISLAL